MVYLKSFKIIICDFQIDADFIAKYQMSYGTTETSSNPESTTESSSTVTTASTSAPRTTPSTDQHCYSYYAQSGRDGTCVTDSKEYREWYEYYYGGDHATAPAKSTGTDSATSTTDIPPAPEDVDSEEYYHWYSRYYGGGSQWESDTDKETYWEQYLHGEAPSQQQGQSQENTEQQEESIDGEEEEKGTEKRKAPEPRLYNWLYLNNNM